MDAEHLPATVEPTPLLLIQQALDAKIAPSDLKELFDLQVRYEQRRAEEAYADAITAFQAECPMIGKNAVNSHSGKKYADYEGIMRVITPLLRRHRIVITFDTTESADKMLTTCRVRVGVVEKVTTISLPVDSASKMMNAMQAGGSAMTYGRRYALTAALNLVLAEEDNDGQSLDSRDDSNDDCTPEEIDALKQLVNEYEAVSRRKVSTVKAMAWLFNVPEAEAKLIPFSALKQSHRRKWTDDLTYKLNHAKAAAQ